MASGKETLPASIATDVEKTAGVPPDALPNPGEVSDSSSAGVEKISDSPSKGVEKTSDSLSGNAKETPDESPDTKSNEPPTEYPSWRKVIPIIIALYFAMFLVALDRTIIATAIPRITDQFHSLNQVGWYGSAYLLTSSAFQLLFGRIYTFYNPKNVFIVAIILFEIGSVVCGAAPNSTAFIIGRAIAGLGSSGIFGGAIVIIVYIVPLNKRPLLSGLFGAIFGVASIAGPLIGGAFTSKVSWRWCFYINLPIGAVTLVFLVLFLKLPDPRNAGMSLRQQIAQLDPLGNLFFLPSVVCLLLALEWGGSTYAWNNGRIIALLIIFAILFSIFIVIQIREQENATVPPRIFKQRSILAGVLFSACLGSAMIIAVYYLPIWFQAIKDLSAVASGIRTLPLVLSLVVGAMFSGALTHRIGYYTPFMFLSTIIMSIGAGLFTTFTPNTGHAKWIGYQVIFGFGIGNGMQQAQLGAQTVLENKDVSTGVSLMFFSLSLCSAVFLSVGQNIFTNKLISGLTGIPGFDPLSVVNTGATEIRGVVQSQYLGRVLYAYNHAITDVFDIALALACLSLLGAIAMEWKSVKGKQQGGV